MHAARLVIVLLIILAVVAAYNPQAREQAAKAWEKVSPVVVSITDSLYVTIRNIITSDTSRDGAGEKPVPGPGADFQRIVTMNSSSAF